MVRYLAAVYGAELAFIGEPPPPATGRVRVLASWQNGVELPEGYEFDLRETMTCATVEREGLLVSPRNLQAPTPTIATSGASVWTPTSASRCPVPAQDIAYLALMSSRPMDPDEGELAVLRIFGARAEAEAERRRHQGRAARARAAVAAARALFLRRARARV